MTKDDRIPYKSRDTLGMSLILLDLHVFNTVLMRMKIRIPTSSGIDIASAGKGE
ncbi:putative transducin beta-like protein 3 [Sesbania bispinosa]|nr:putative transducin beta-like protein 3 [Sesbania bispinosa]